MKISVIVFCFATQLIVQVCCATTVSLSTILPETASSLSLRYVGRQAEISISSGSEKLVLSNTDTLSLTHKILKKPLDIIPLKNNSAWILTKSDNYYGIVKINTLSGKFMEEYFGRFPMFSPDNKFVTYCFWVTRDKFALLINDWSVYPVTEKFLRKKTGGRESSNGTHDSYFLEAAMPVDANEAYPFPYAWKNPNTLELLVREEITSGGLTPDKYELWEIKIAAGGKPLVESKKPIDKEEAEKVRTRLLSIMESTIPAFSLD